MASAFTDARQRSDFRDERPPLPPRADRRPPPPLPPLPELPGRGRSARSTAGPRDRSDDRPRADRVRPTERGASQRPRDRRGLREDAEGSRARAPRNPAEPSRPVARETGRPRRDDSRASRPVEQAEAGASGGRLRGFVAVLAVFLVTLGGAAVDSFTGIGLGMITLVSLVASTAVAVLLVRRRDMVSVVLAPPLVFTAVAGLNIALAPSVSLCLPTAATLMIRGFPTMAVATVAAVVLTLVRLATRR
jgi:hypothetical protein